ncbi:MAG TPA: hypothetical protein VEX86_06975 [Longimicrobium sp.]|nr:hypothetical protein [Longimicrobium sp.]
MLLLRCTQRLLDASRTIPEQAPAPAEGLLGEWYANVAPLPFPGRWAVMFTHAQTLLTVVAPGRVLRTTVPVFRERLPALLRRLEIPEAWIAEHAPLDGEVRVARTDSRRVLGSMNDLASGIWYGADEAPSFDRLDLATLERDLATTPLTFLGHASPDRAMLGLAGLGWAKRGPRFHAVARTPA